MPRTALDICIRAHQVARARNRNDMIFGIITAPEMKVRAERISRAFDVRWRRVVGRTDKAEGYGRDRT